MEQVMTLREIEAQFDDEWVLIANPETDNDLHVLGGEVICHSKDRDEVYRRMQALRLPDYAVLFTGEMPEEHGGCLMSESFNAQRGLIVVPVELFGPTGSMSEIRRDLLKDVGRVLH